MFFYGEARVMDKIAAQLYDNSQLVALYGKIAEILITVCAVNVPLQ